MKLKTLSTSLFTCLLIVGISSFSFSQNVAINGSGALPAASSMLDISSTSEGLLIPRMTTAQKTAIAAPATGLLIYQTDGLSGFWYYTGAIWIRLGNGDGTVTSVATTAPLSGGTITTSGTLSISQASTSTDGYLSSTDWNTFNNKPGGSGTATRVAFWSAATTLSSNAALYWDNTTSALGVGTSAPGFRLDVLSAARAINGNCTVGTAAGVFGFNTAAAGAGAGG